MKKIEFIFIAVLLLIVFQSCEDPFGGGEPIPTCEWDENNQVGFTDLQLQHPSGLSNFHINQIPIDGIERSLLNILEINGDTGLPSRAIITVGMFADGQACFGEKTVSFRQGAPEVSIASINVPFVSNAVFFGEVTVGIESDTFINPTGSDALYYILWEDSGNDPNGGVVGNVTGTKITFNNSNEDGSTGKKIISDDGCYYQNGQLVCL